MDTRTALISNGHPVKGLEDANKTEEAWLSLIEEKDRRIQELTAELKRMEERSKVELAERERWAQYLHDTITQSLFSAGLIAEVLPRLWERDPAAAKASLEDLRRLTFGAIGEMRLLLAESRPSLLTEMELGDLLSLLGNALAGRLNIPVSMDIETKTHLPADVQVSLFNFCKEVFHLIMQRASAKEVSLKVLQSGLATEIHIREFGDTFEAASVDSLRTANTAAALGITVAIQHPSGEENELVVCWKGTEEANQP